LAEELASSEDASLDAVRLQLAQFVWQLEHETPGGPLADVPDPSGLHGPELSEWYDDHLDDLLTALDEERGGSTFDSLARAYESGAVNAETQNDSADG
jgi:hypothetical protein